MRRSIRGWGTLTETNATATPKIERAKPARRADIQGLRAIAVIVVVAFHGNLAIPGGFVGVDVFFVISGFVITAMLLREKQRDGRIDIATFYVRRFRRLTPALALVVSVTLVVSAVLMSPVGSQQLTAATALGAMFLFANIAIARTTGGYFDAAAETNPLLHTWSLSVEEQFYLVFPVLFITGWLWGKRSGHPLRGVALAILAMAAISFVIAMAPAFGRTVPLVPDALIGFYGPIGRAWEFASGALLAVAMLKMPPASRAVAQISGVVGAGLLVVSFFVISEATTFPGPATLVPVVATLLLLFAGRSSGNVVSRLLSTRPMVSIGDISYSWYLWHWPAIVFAVLLWPQAPMAAPLAALLSIVPAVLSYRFVEQRFRAKGKSSRKRLIALVAVTLLVPVGFAGVLATAAQNGYWSPRIASMQDTQRSHAGFAAGCMSYEPITVASESNCEWNGAAAGEPIYLIGDSIAEHYSEALIGAATALDRPLYMVTAPGCPAYPVVLEIPIVSGLFDATENGLCDPYIDGTLSWLDDKTPGLVIMGANDVNWWAPSALVDPAEQMGEKTDAVIAESRRALVDGISTSVTRLQSAGHEVAIAKAPPSYRFPEPSWLPGTCTVGVILVDACGASASVEAMDLLQSGTRDAIDEVAAASGSSVLDVRDFFCPDEVCVTSLGDTQLYRDDIHLSVQGSTLLVPWFTDFIAAL